MFHRILFVLVLLILAWYHILAWTSTHSSMAYVSAAEFSESNRLDSGCRHRDYGNGATVCVCTVDYCDNLDHVDLNLVSAPGPVLGYVTSKDGDRFKRVSIEQGLTNNIRKPELVIKINRNKQYQKIIGFGGAFTDSAGINIDKLRSKLQERLIRDYYGPDGIEYTLGRIPIGGSDFSTRPYTYDDNAGSEDLELSKFQLQYEDFQFKIPFLKMAAKVSPHLVKYFGSPWSPPAWMKTNQKLNNGGFLFGKPGEKYYKAFAKYLVSFLDHYHLQNVSIWGLTIENEPRAGYDPRYRWNSLGFNGTTERDFIKLDLGPLLNEAGYRQLNLMIYDDTLDGIEQFVSDILSDPNAQSLVSGIAYHWYDHPKFPDRKQFDRIMEKYNGKYFLLSTEACEIWTGRPHHVWLGEWNTFDQYAHEIIKDLNHWTSGWVDWNLALNLQGGPNWSHNYVDAPIIVNGTGTEYYKQPFFYALGHFSKFLSSDSIRLGQTLDFDPFTNRSSIQATTFLRPDNRTVLTVLNMGSKPASILVEDFEQKFYYTLKPKSLSSFIWH